MLYLGIKLVPGLEKIMQINFQPVLYKNVYILVWINLVKMTIVPKINYLSCILPLVLPLSLLKEYNKCLEYLI